jgi:hypothetical protein
MNNEINDIEFSIINISSLHKKLTDIFNQLIDLENPNKIYKLHIDDFPPEYYHGFIEYKRTLATYENKIDKLRTQILWRLSEGIIHNEKEMCYYIIGLEDNGTFPKNSIDLTELIDSKKIIEQCIKQTKISMDYRYIQIENYNKNILIIRMWKSNENNQINFNVNWNIGIL